MTAPMRELRLLAKDRAALLWLGIAALVAGLSVSFACTKSPRSTRF